MVSLLSERLTLSTTVVSVTTVSIASLFEKLSGDGVDRVGFSVFRCKVELELSAVGVFVEKRSDFLANVLHFLSEDLVGRSEGVRTEIWSFSELLLEFVELNIVHFGGDFHGSSNVFAN